MHPAADPDETHECPSGLRASLDGFHAGLPEVRVDLSESHVGQLVAPDIRPVKRDNDFLLRRRQKDHQTPSKSTATLAKVNSSFLFSSIWL
jgi:hypothetical protein